MLRHAETPAAVLSEIAMQIASIRDPRARHWIITPSKGRSEQILHEWATRCGIASHSQELELRTLLEQIAAGTRDRFDFDALRLAIAATLPELADHPEFPIASDSATGALTAARLAWATTLARAIDETLQCRPLDQAWAPKSFLNALANHPPIATVLERHPGLQTPHTFTQSANAWLHRWLHQGGVPYLWIQLDAGLPQRLFERLVQTLNFFRENGLENHLHLFAISPSFEYWSEQLTRSRNHRQGRPENDPERNPGGLLWSLGRCSQDFQSQIIAPLLSQGAGGIEIPSPICPSTLLGLLQESCRRSAPPDERAPLDPDDASLTVHVAHNHLREMEICRDRILQSLHDFPDLRHEEILLLLANPREQAPFVEAAFHGSPEAIVPFRLSGAGQTIPSTFAAAVELLLGILPGRISLPDVQSLLENPLIASHFGFDTESNDAGQVLEWLEDAGFRWGLNADQRLNLQHLPEHRWNLRWALQRLALGGVVAPPSDQSPRPVFEHSQQPMIPLERASGLSLDLLAKLAQFLETLESAAHEWRTGHEQSLGAWIDSAERLVNAFLAPNSPSEQGHANSLKNSVLPSFRRIVNPSALLETSGFARLLLEKISALNDTANRGHGGVRVGDLRQLAGVPARLILIAGLDHETFPRKEDRPAWHPLALKPACGDPSLRDADRHALLLAILSAKQRLVLTYRGKSDEDQKERPPSTALADILSTVDTLIASENKQPAHRAIIHSHPLNGTSVRAFRSGTNRNACGFNPADHRIVRTRTQAKSQPRSPQPYRGLWADILPEAPDLTPALEDLRTLLQNPVTLFLKRLGIRVPKETEDPAGHDLIELDGLSRWNLRDELLLAQLEGNDPADFQEQLARSGRLPRGLIGESIFQDIVNEIPQTETYCAEDRIAQSCRCYLPGLDAEQPEILLEGRLRTGWYQRRSSPDRAYFSASSFHNAPWRQELLLKLEAVALTASQPSSGKTSGVFQDEKVTLPLADPNEARRTLRRLIPLYQLALQIPLPFWPVASAKLFPSPDAAYAEETLDAARQKWTDRNFNSAQPPESEDSSSRIAFRGLDDPWGWMPEVAAPFLPDEGRPLAWRVARFLHDWKGSIPSTLQPSSTSKKKR
jgi:exodeoxyribonuclease V gamma subunit